MTNTENYKFLINAIITAQVGIIGPLALDISKKVVGLDKPDKKVLEELVKQYETLFGQASIETCKDAIKDIKLKFADIDLPQILE